jgi:alpha-1,2-mannosyltransferase
VAHLTARERRALLIAGVLYAAVVIPIGIHKGDDFESHVGQADRLLRGMSLYEANPPLGVQWPPFALLALTPFALVVRASLPLAKGAYALLGVACLGWSLARLQPRRWTSTLLALAAVAVPLQTNFEYLNLNAVLLALVVAAGLDLTAARDGRAGVWLGLATALKLFPGLLLAYCAYRRRWRALAVGAALALGLSIVPLLPYGPAGALATAQRWIALTLDGSWLPHRGNQSLAALVGRAGGSHDLALAAQATVLVLIAVALRRRTTDEAVLRDVGIVTLAALLFSPIAWSHSFLLAFPAWVAALERERRPRAAWVALLVAGIATSGFLTIWSRGVKLALLELSIYTWGALLLLAALAFLPTAERTGGEHPL